MIRNPKYYTKKGKGTLSTGNTKADVEFELFLISGEVVFYCKPTNKSPYIFNNADQFTLNGFTEENKRIQANNLLAPLIKGNFIELIPNSIVFIGD